MSVKIALAGNPNSGKTTLFNALTGSNQFVGNWPGVTVEKKEGKLRGQKDVIIMDLPGIYSLSPYTLEEVVARNYLIGDRPDAIINIVDGTNIERNLYLSTQLMELGIPVIMAVNMMDIVQKNGDMIDTGKLGEKLGCEVTRISALKGTGVMETADRAVLLAKSGNAAKAVHEFGEEAESIIKRVEEQIVGIVPAEQKRFFAVKLLEKDDKIKEQMPSVPDVSADIKEMEAQFDDDTESIITNERYVYISSVIAECVQKNRTQKLTISDKIDRWVTNRWLALPIFAIVMWLVYYVSVSTVGAFVTDWTNDVLFGEIVPPAVEGILVAVNCADWLKGLILDGIVAGVGAVLGFVPQMLVLFIFLAFLEGCGYMARVAFIMDRMMHKIGLHGKSFIPLLIGFGCNVPAIMATRTLESRRDRIMTMLITPFMSCSARLPVYILIVSAFFPVYQGLVLLSVYLIGILLSIGTALLLKKTIFARSSEPFVMELPPYRMPTMRNTVIHMWGKAGQYLKKMGTIILFASVLIWALGYFPLNRSANVDAAEHLEESYIGHIGKFIEPAIRPLGFDWKMGVSIVTGLAAKEIVVSSMGILYHVPDAGENMQGLAENLRKQVNERGEKVFTPLVAYVFMLFILIYFPCMAVIAAIRKEAGWRWALFTIFYTTSLAWFVSFCVYQIGSLL